MSNIKPIDFVKGGIRYDIESQYFFNKEGQTIAELRGWGAIQNLFKNGNDYDLDAAAKFQDEVGDFIAQTINKGLEQ